MTINLRETLLTLTQAAATLPNKPHASTIHRWRLNGVRGIRLETIMVGGRRYTSREALERFSARLTAAADGEPPPSRTGKQREKAIAAAETVLEEAGISE